MTLSAPEMPERIWLIPDIGWDGETAWSNDPAPEPGMDPDNATEYLRKDLCALTPAPQPEATENYADPGSSSPSAAIPTSETVAEAQIDAIAVVLSKRIYKQTEGEWQPSIRQADELARAALRALKGGDANG